MTGRYFYLLSYGGRRHTRTTRGIEAKQARLAVELAKTGSDKTADQCRAKMKKKKETKVQKGEGQTQQNWARKEYLAFFNALDAVLGDRPTSQPTAILDMSAPPTNESDSEVPQDCDKGDESTIDI